MSENIRQFIEQLAAGQSAESKESLEKELSSRSFDALDEYKKEISQSIFGGTHEDAKTEIEMDFEDKD